MRTGMWRTLVVGTAAGALLAAGASAATAAKVQIYKKQGSPENLPAATDNDVYTIPFDSDDLTAFCGRNATPLAPGWSGVPAFVPDAGPRFSPVNSYYELGVRGAVEAGNVRGRAICARGLAATLKTSRTSTVSCGQKTAIGVPLTSAGPYQEATAEARPLSRTRWRATVDDATTTTLCVPKNALKNVQTVKQTKPFVVGRTSVGAAATCKGARKPVGWGFALPLMDQNAYEDGPSSVRNTPYISRSAPSGKKGWKLTFQTADGLGAKTPAKVTTYVTCAIPGTASSQPERRPSRSARGDGPRAR